MTNQTIRKSKTTRELSPVEQVSEIFDRLDGKIRRHLPPAEATKIPRTVRDVNRALKSLGISERLSKGNGYYYFRDGEASGWFSSSVTVCYVDDLNLGQWIEEYFGLASTLMGNESRVFCCGEWMDLVLETICPRCGQSFNFRGEKCETGKGAVWS